MSGLDTPHHHQTWSFSLLRSRLATKTGVPTHQAPNCNSYSSPNIQHAVVRAAEAQPANIVSDTPTAAKPRHPCIEEAITYFRRALLERSREFWPSPWRSSVPALPNRGSRRKHAGGPDIKTRLFKRRPTSASQHLSNPSPVGKGVYPSPPRPLDEKRPVQRSQKGSTTYIRNYTSERRGASI